MQGRNDMTQLAENKVVTQFAEIRPTASGLRWLDELRNASLSRFKNVGFPGPREEAWRHTNLTPITRQTFSPAKVEFDGDVEPLVKEFSFGKDAAVELVFVNGVFAASLSRVGNRTIRVASLEDALKTDG